MQRPLKLTGTRPNGLLSLIVWTLLGSFTLLLCVTGITAFARGDARYERPLHPGPDLRLEGRGGASEDLDLLGRPVPYISAPRTLDLPVPTVSVARPTSERLVPNVIAASATSERVVPNVIAAGATSEMAIPAVSAAHLDRPAPSVGAAGPARQNSRAQGEAEKFRTADAGLKEPAPSPTSDLAGASLAVPGDAAENGSDLATLGLAALLFVTLIAVVAFI